MPRIPGKKYSLHSPEEQGRCQVVKYNDEIRVVSASFLIAHQYRDILYYYTHSGPRREGIWCYGFADVQTA